MRWKEGALGYYWPAKPTSEEGPICFQMTVTAGDWNHRKQNIGVGGLLQLCATFSLKPPVAFSKKLIRFVKEGSFQLQERQDAEYPPFPFFTIAAFLIFLFVCCCFKPLWLQWHEHYHTCASFPNPTGSGQEQGSRRMAAAKEGTVESNRYGFDSGSATYQCDLGVGMSLPKPHASIKQGWSCGRIMGDNIYTEHLAHAWYIINT